MCIPQVLQNMRMKTLLRFTSLLTSLHGINHQKNIQNMRLLCQIINVRSPSLPQWQVDQCLSMQLSCTQLDVDVMDDDNIVIALSAQIQINIVMTDMVKSHQ